MKEMENFSVTITYKAVYSVDIKAESEEDARLKAVDLVKKSAQKIGKPRGISLQDAKIIDAGCVNMDQSWNQVQD